MFAILAQAPPPPAPSPPISAATIFYLTLLFIFLTAIITTVATKWSRDKCLKFFHRYHVTLERYRGQTIWGKLKVFSSGLEVIYDNPFIDAHGRKKTSFMMYQQEMENQLLSLFRYHDELSPEQQRERSEQIQRTFNPGPLRRFMRGVRNFVNTLRDAFNAAIGTAVGQFQRANPSSAVLTSQAGNVTQIGQTLLGKFAANAFEPLLEQYIGQPVILDVADPINPNNATVEYAGYLAEYTQYFIALFNVNHKSDAAIEVTLPDVERGEPLPPLSAPPPPGAPAPVLPPPAKVEHDVAVRIDGLRLKVQNLRHDPLVARRLEREGFEPVEFGMVIPPNGTLDLPARDARGGKLVLDVVRCLDVVAPRKFANVRHAGELVDRRGFVDELNLDQLPLVPKLFGNDKQERFTMEHTETKVQVKSPRP
ncbi:MAG TPA: hypothetical protein VGR35_14335 [Tepidisphaeraceae bacterium]|nr:hypothetical protein [Tepidisphaeraceae bacterium]